MSGGVDSSVAAVLVKEAGHEAVGATMKLWGGASDSGCCSVSDVDDARRVADAIGIDYRVFNFVDEFSAGVVDRYVAFHRQGRTPNPCVDCNSVLKFGALVDRARRLGFDAVATGHHARVEIAGATATLRRGVDSGKDQSYVLSTLSADQLRGVLFPIGSLSKLEVREIARSLGLRTAAKPDSQDVCFVTSRSNARARRDFLAGRIPLHPGRIVDATSGADLGALEAVELVTVGQRRGLGVGGGERRYALRVDMESLTVIAGPADDLLVDGVNFSERTWFDGELEPGTPVFAQTSAHGAARPARLSETGITFAKRERRVAPGQVVACYVGDVVVGSGVAA